MEMMWPVLVVMVPLFIGGFIAVVMYWRHDPAGTTDSVGDAAGAFRRPVRKENSRSKLRTIMVSFAGVALAILLALTVGVPLIRGLLIALHIPIETG